LPERRFQHSGNSQQKKTRRGGAIAAVKCALAHTCEKRVKTLLY